MDKEPNSTHKVVDTYRQRALRYDLTVRSFDAFAWLGFNISGWRREAICALNLKPEDSVIDIGCGTGLNFALLYRAVGPGGKIIGVDVSSEMLAQAQQRVAANQWANIQLVCSDASQFEFPRCVDTVLSTYALTLIPDCERVVSRACQALVPGGRLVVLDMAWPRYCPLWWRHILFFLRSYGVTGEVIRRRPWETVQQVMEGCLRDIDRKRFWFGFFYLISGTARNLAQSA